jgi:Mediator complex subunit Med5
VYEEFGAILLLVLTVTNRYELTPAEIGITNTTSFVRQLMEADAAEESLDDLDEPKRQHLGDWIAALFVADSLSDELTSSCSPRDFYKILPTLLNQSLAACACGKLSIEVLKSGFDCKSAKGKLCSPSLINSHRLTGAFPAALACRGVEMACQSPVANVKRCQSLAVSSPVIGKATIVNGGTRDTPDNSYIDCRAFESSAEVKTLRSRSHQRSRIL